MPFGYDKDRRQVMSDWAVDSDSATDLDATDSDYSEHGVSEDASHEHARQDGGRICSKLMVRQISRLRSSL